MLYSIKDTKMIRAAKDSLDPSRNPQSIFTECMIFLLVTMISTLPQEFVSSIAIFFIMFTDPKYYELIGSSVNNGEVNTDQISAYVENLIQSLPSWFYAVILASSAFMILGAIIYCRSFQKRKPFTLGFNKRGVIGEYGAGIVIGFIMISLPALFCYVTKCVTFTISDSIDPAAIVLFFGAFLLQGMGEEALFRGYLLTSLSRRYNTWTAIIVSSLMFSVFHIANANFSLIAFINIALFGMFAAVFMLKRGSIWAVGAIHSMWNFAQGNIFGFSVSGNPKFASLLNADNADFGTILSGGNFGLEGGLGATIILLIAILLALLMPTKQCELYVDDNIDVQV